MYGKDLTSLKLGKLTVIKNLGALYNNGKGRSFYLCKCECGNEKKIPRYRLTRKINPSRSCGCVKSHSDPKTVKLQSAKRVYRRYRDGDLSFENFLFLSQKPCYYCGSLPSNVHNEFNTKRKKVSRFAIKHGDFIYNGLDRKDNKQPHNKNNLVSCCWKCNDAKGSMTLREFKAWIRKVYLNIQK